MVLHRLFTDHDTDVAQGILRAISEDDGTAPEMRETAIRYQSVIQPMMEREALRPLLCMLASAGDDPRTPARYRGNICTWLAHLESWIARQ
jgi:hypothetical protein